VFTLAFAFALVWANLKKVTWGDWTHLISREDREQYKLSRYTWVICSPADGTPSTERFVSTRWCSSTLGPNSERVSEQNFSKQTDWAGRPIPWPLLRSPDITPLDFFFLGYVKDQVDQVFCPKFGSVVELRARINSAAASVPLQMLENTEREVEYSLYTLRTTNGAHIEMYWTWWFVHSSKANQFSVLAYSVFCVYLKCGEQIVASLRILPAYRPVLPVRQDPKIETYRSS
jgi:hypothetical protein